MKVLVTGANGFIGKHLFNNLSRVSSVELVPYSPKSFEDLVTNPLEAEKCDIVVHLAGKAFIPESWQNPYSYYKINTEGTLNVLEYCRQNKAFLIFLSSVVYTQPFNNPILETDKRGASNPYTHSKLLAEELCLFYQDNFGVDVAILRPFNIFGPGQKKSFLIPTIIDQILDDSKKSIQLQNLVPKRDYLYVDDLISLILNIILKPVPGTFNVGLGESYSVLEIAEMACKLANVSKPILGSEFLRPNDPLDVRADISKAGDTFNWKPKVSLESGLDKIIQLKKKEFKLKKLK